MGAQERTNFFEEAYRKGRAEWDVGIPQPAFVRAEEAGEIKGDVLDVGCGTGENALFLASQGHRVWGIDIAPTAVERARAKASERGLSATFAVHSALELKGLGATFDAVIDCGLFHALSDGERVSFEKGLRAVIRPNGTYHMLCFSDKEPDWGGPRRITQGEIRATFNKGWRIDYIRADLFRDKRHKDAGRAWFSSITRVQVI